MSQVNIYNFDPNDPNNTGRTTQQDGLNIFVSLEATPRKRSTKNRSVDKTIEFVKGTVVDGRNSLTTNYVNVGYDFSNDSNLETLNIKSINIDFNSSYVPLVSMVFIDTRGDSLMAKGKSSKYANVFFDLPYPVFKLTVKGEYGKAVSYCLHLTKFNSKFNSATGDFEIFCDFIGYTYAFFSDILLGYLKAIGEFPEVKEKLKSEGLISINDFRIQNELLNSKIEKLSKTNDTYKQIGVINNTLRRIEELNDKLINYGSSDSETINRIGAALVGGDENLINSFIVLKNYGTNQANLLTFLSSLQNNIIEINRRLNSKISFQFENPDDSRFTLIGSDGNNLRLTENKIISYKDSIINNTKAINDISDEIYKEINNLITNKSNIYIILSMYAYVKEIKIIKSNLEKRKKELTDKLGEDIKQLTKTTFDNFEPTVYNVFSMFTRHIELFMETLQDVGIKAEEEHAKANSLIGKQKSNLDKNIERDFIPAFPMYYEGKTEEKWIGSVDPKLPEVTFIEKLIDSLVNGNVSFNQTVDNLYGNDVDSATNYFPIHAKDIYGNPYVTLGNTESIDNIKKILTNRMLFAIYTNGYLTIESINALAKAEAYNTYFNITNADVLNTLVNLTNDKIFNTPINDSNIININNIPYDYIGTNQSNVFNFNQIKEIDTLFLNQNQFNDINIKLAPNYSDNIINTEKEHIFSLADRRDFKSDDTSNRIIKFTNQVYFIWEGTGENYQYNSILTNKNLLFNTIINNISIKGVVYNVNNIFYEKLDDLKTERFNKDSGIRFTSNNIKNNDFRKNLTSDIKVDALNAKLVPGYYNVINKDNAYDFYSDSRNDISKKLTNISNLVTTDFKINFKTPSVVSDPKYWGGISLFGSKFYYKQSEDIRAMLFLSSSPILENIDLTLELFGKRANIVKLPTLLRIIIGCYLYRLDNNIEFHKDSQALLNFNSSKLNVYLPKKDRFYTSLYTNVTERDVIEDVNFYKKIPDFILNLPKNLKDSFKKRYTEWRDSVDFGKWGSVKKKLEIYYKNEDSNFLYNSNVFEEYYKNNDNFNRNVLLNNKYYETAIPIINIIFAKQYVRFEKVLDNQETINFFNNNNKNNYMLLLKTDITNDNVKELNNEISQLFFNDFEYYINYNPYIWNNNIINDITNFSKNKYNYKDTYTTTFVSTLQELDKQNKIKQFKQDKKVQAFKELFNSDNRDEIKLNIYRNIKSIYDKWIGDGELPYRTCLGLNKNQKLIDTFKFVDKLHKPIGHQIYINPKSLSNRISASINTSFVSLASSLLSDMKFDFIPLPSYIEYNNTTEAKNLFKPYEFYDLVDDSANTVVRPSFVCMYVNTASNRLDLENSNYNNDGKVFNLGDNTYTNDNVDSNLVIPAFTVNYGSENQAIFKDIELNQNEFSTTDETLVIIDNLSNRDAVNESVFLGQNLFDIYSKRSYTAKISLLGNVTLMPMHYFQLNNIPLFSGAYIITRVSHSISNNTMNTEVTGVRISVNDVPIIRDNKLFLALASEDIDSIVIDNGNQINFNNNTTSTKTGNVATIESDFIDE